MLCHEVIVYMVVNENIHGNIFLCLLSVVWIFLSLLLNWTVFCRMLDILEKFLIRKGYSFSRLDGSTPTNLRQSMVDDFNSSPSKQVIRFFQVQTHTHKKSWFSAPNFFLTPSPVSGVPHLNSSWWAWVESCKCKSCGYIWSKLESCLWFTGPGQIFSFWTEAACCSFPPSCSWVIWGTCLFPSSVQTTAVKYCCFRENGKTLFWGRPGAFFSCFEGSWLLRHDGKFWVLTIHSIGFFSGL